MADLAEQRLDVLRLDGDHHELGAVDRHHVRVGRLDAVGLTELFEALVATRRDDEVPRLAPAGREQAGDERLADLAGAEDCDPSAHAAEK